MWQFYSDINSKISAAETYRPAARLIQTQDKIASVKRLGVSEK